MAYSNSDDANHEGRIDRPTHDVIARARSTPNKEQQKHASVGLRLKVRFKDDIWYGGRIAGVIDGGQKIDIEFDDGTEESASFPDKDIIVDDVNNETHPASSLSLSQAFLPPSSSSSRDLVNKSDMVEECSPVKQPHRRPFSIPQGKNDKRESASPARRPLSTLHGQDILRSKASRVQSRLAECRRLLISGATALNAAQRNESRAGHAGMLPLQ